jgi:hypothetical protein
VCFVESEVRPVRSGAGEEGAVFGGSWEGRMGVFGALCVCVGFEVSVPVGCGFF